MFERARKNKHHLTLSGAEAEHELSLGAGASGNCGGGTHAEDALGARQQADSGIESCTSTATPSVSSPSSLATAPPSGSGGMGMARSSPHNSSSTIESATTPAQAQAPRTCSEGAVTPVTSSSAPSHNFLDEDIYAVNQLSFCPDSRRLLIAGSFHALLFNFSRKEIVSEVTVS